MRPQTDEYSCAVACVATVAAILSRTIAEEDIRRTLAPSPETGVGHADLVPYAQKHLGATDFGAGVYKDGPAIANILQDGHGHYVVFLDRRGDEILYYDPEHNALCVKKERDIDWRAEQERVAKWSINFEKPPGYNTDALFLDAKKLKLPGNVPRL